jgi:hypothetical protein
MLAVLVALAAFAAVPATAPAIPQYHGIQLHTLWWQYPDGDVARDLDLAAAAHANVIRVDVSWSTLESGEKGVFTRWYLNKLDALMSGASARGMQVIATLYGSPCWASTAPASLKQGCQGAWWNRGVAAYPPADDRDYADIARWMTRRYGTWLAALEIWNEPNLPNGLYWKTKHPAARYAQLVKDTYDAAKAGNYAVPVLAGSLANADRTFLESLYADGIQGYYDGISVHPFSARLGPRDVTEERYRQYTFLDGLRWVRDGMTAEGDYSPVWITEFGWTTSSGTPWEVSEDVKSRYLADSFEALDALPWVKTATLYDLRDTGTAPGDFEAGFGVVRQDFTPKESYRALQTVLGGGHWGKPLPAQFTDGTRLSVRLSQRSGVVFAGGTAPPLRLVYLRLTGTCPRHGARTFAVRASFSGRWSRRVGALDRVGGCRLSAKVPATGQSAG